MSTQTDITVFGLIEDIQVTIPSSLEEFESIFGFDTCVRVAMAHILAHSYQAQVRDQTEEILSEVSGEKREEKSVNGKKAFAETQQAFVDRISSLLNDSDKASIKAKIQEWVDSNPPKKNARTVNLAKTGKVAKKWVDALINQIIPAGKLNSLAKAEGIDLTSFLEDGKLTEDGINVMARALKNWNAKRLAEAMKKVQADLSSM